MNNLQLHFFAQHIKEAQEEKKLTNTDKAVLGGIGAYSTYTVADAYRNRDKSAKDSRAKAVETAMKSHKADRKASDSKLRDALEAGKREEAAYQANKPKTKPRKKTILQEAAEKLQDIADNADFTLPKTKNPLEGFKTTKITPDEYFKALT